VNGKLNYASIAVVDNCASGSVAIETISIEESGATLAGAWVLEITENNDIENILSNRLLLAMNAESEALLTKFGFWATINIDTFLQDAVFLSGETLGRFNAYVSANPKKRNKLVEPSLMKWPSIFNLEQSGAVLESLGKQKYPENTPVNFRKTLAASKLLKLLIDSWLSDEEERTSRKFLGIDPNWIRLLPPSWLAEFENLSQKQFIL
jgi:hypothetical protein